MTETKIDFYDLKDFKLLSNDGRVLSIEEIVLSVNIKGITEKEADSILEKEAKGKAEVVIRAEGFYRGETKTVVQGILCNYIDQKEEK